MGLKSYPKYILTNDVLHSIPEGWRTERLNDVTDIRTSTVDKKSLDGQNPVRLCNYKDVYYNDKIKSDIHFMESTASENEIIKFSLAKGDVVFTKDSEDRFDIGIPSYIDDEIEDLVCGYHLTVVRVFKADLIGEYTYYALKSELAKHQFTLASNGVTRFGLTYQGTKNIKICVPSLPEQKQIANYLDYKIIKINRLIDKKKQLIKKLNEKRLAVITQTVTKGLDPLIPMKDSEVDWLDMVPKHWEIRSVKFLTKIIRGKFSHRPRNDPAFYGGDYPFIQTGDVSGADKYVTSYTQTLNEKGLSVSKEFPAGTLVMTIAANIGDMAIINFAACFPDSIVGFVPEDSIELDYLYLMFLAMKQKLMSTAVLNTQLNLNIDRIANIRTAIPPRKEQKDIVKSLECQMNKIGKTVEKMETAIENLSEYRTALITAAVTGKIDVRGIEIPIKEDIDFGD